MAWATRIALPSARLLLVIPLLFVCESRVDPRMAGFVRSIVNRGIVPPDATAALDAEVSRSNRRANAWWPEAVWLLFAVALALTQTRLQIYGTTDVADPSRTSLAAMVYFHAGVTLFRPAVSLGLEARALDLVPLARVSPICA